LLQRALTAVVLLAGFLAALFWLPRSGVAVLAALLIGVAAAEWARLCRLSTIAATGYALGVVCALAALLWVAKAGSPDRHWQGGVFAAATLFWMVGVPLWMATGVRASARRLIALAGFAVLLPAALALVILPPMRVLGVLALVWIADAAAYFVGRSVGRRKLAPGISPGKTWEGAIGGLLAVLVYAIICGFTVPALRAHLDGGGAWFLYLGAGVLLCGVSVIGDLFESAVKRQASVKDSGTLLPGHGGVLDRIDSAVAVLPVAALISAIVQTT
jgi:phosphatidate cytidylyltransferase